MNETVAKVEKKLGERKGGDVSKKGVEGGGKMEGKWSSGGVLVGKGKKRKKSVGEGGRQRRKRRENAVCCERWCGRVE